MIIDFYDTSVILARPELLNTENFDNYISHFVIQELESIKNSNTKSEEIKANARKAVRILQNKPNIKTYNINYKLLEKIKRKNPWLPQNNDGNILAEAFLLEEGGEKLCFWTADYNMYLFAKEKVSYINFIKIDEQKKEEPWAGWGKYYPQEKEMNMLYSDATINILGAKVNEYCEIYENNELKDILRWDGEKYCKLKYSNFKSPLGQNISPRNLEQEFLFDLLQNKDIKVSLITGKFGTGKSMLALAHSLWQVQKGEYDKIIFIKNNIQLKDTENIGSMAPLYSNI